MSIAQKQRPGNGTLYMLAAILIAAAVALGVVAYLCISTTQYTHYAQHLSEWEQKAVTQQQLADSTQDATNRLMYQEAAAAWNDTIKTAKNYLTLHRLGAAALALVSLFCIGISVWMVVASSKKKQDPPAEPAQTDPAAEKS